ncbi:acyl-CoA carboxylase subunit beta [Brevibacillus sp. B_LB10_24]|uniref:acyl-CoA carboxylase subunit beta n=1 Tax=Brevibacillus sp. B_LB10_24 TaxID=3380645 RepID=UPI0038BB9243
MGGQQKVEQQHSLGRGTARERIGMLVDSGTFMELGLLNHSDLPGHEEQSPADGLICGLGKVAGRPVVVQAMDKTVFGGATGHVSKRKAREVKAYAVKRGLPVFELAEGSGLRMPDGMGSDGISASLPTRDGLMTARQVPGILGIMGDSFGAPTWHAVTSDYVVQVKGTCMAVAGPRMLEVATGETIAAEDLGGWKLHAEVTGQNDDVAESEQECIDKMRAFFSYMPLNAQQEPPFKRTEDDPWRRIDDAVQIVPTKRNRAYDMTKLIRSIVDDQEFFPLKPLFGRALITGLARLDGRVVGIVASQPLYSAGAAGPDECDKATEFICLCDSFHIPLIFLLDTPGFRIGSVGEREKIPTKIMVWNQALAYSTVPKLSVIVRKAIGMAYANMCGPGMGADFVAAWPTAEINFTGPEVGINVVYGRQLMNAENPSEERKELLHLWSFDSSPYKAAAKHYIDDVIDPRDTRKFLCQSLEYACVKNGSKSQRLLANWPTGF